MNTEELLKILACPRCKGDLTLAGGDSVTPEGFACETCGVVYPVREDIPVMLLEEAVPKADWDAGKRSVK
ncbi:MAG: Trm112 family protein [Desulfovibrio sp.]|nr:Trm112 family protein [Desulfovibrio sp.]